MTAKPNDKTESNASFRSQIKAKLPQWLREMDSYSKYELSDTHEFLKLQKPLCTSSPYRHY